MMRECGIRTVDLWHACRQASQLHLALLTQTVSLEKACPRLRELILRPEGVRTGDPVRVSRLMLFIE